VLTGCKKNKCRKPTKTELPGFVARERNSGSESNVQHAKGEKTNSRYGRIISTSGNRNSQPGSREWKLIEELIGFNKSSYYKYGSDSKEIATTIFRSHG
jgi:hypothetical protein